MNQRLQEVINLVPMIKQMTGMDAAICVWNTEAVVEAFFAAENMGLLFQVGYQLENKTDKIYDVLRTGVAQYNKIPKEVFGYAVEGTITPIFDGKEIVGVVTYGFSTEVKNQIVSSANNLTESIHQTEASIAEIKNGTIDIENNMQQVQKITELVKAQVEEASEVVAQIQKNANYSNILALNASIESARAGQMGRGFAVVSDEMRKFSKMSGDAAAKISKNLAEIVNSLNEVKDSVDHSATTVNMQAKAMKELNETFEGVATTADKVTKICKQITHF